MTTISYLIINADDFGYCPERNRGIIEAFNNKSISSSTLLVNSLFAENAVKLAFDNNMPLGLHFNITEGKPISRNVSSLVDDFGCFFGKFGLRQFIDSNRADLEHVKFLNLFFFVLEKFYSVFIC
jgi:predicted glycoside hydrolase/deacetylase ChbG (UPF0249 family)